MTTTETRILLVGAGEQGWESRGPSIQALADEGVFLAGIADPDPRQLSWTADRLGVERTYPSMSAALEKARFDGVILAVPNHLHEPLAIEALAAECNVLVEKPIALDVDGGKRMLAAARAAGRLLLVGYQYPWMHPGLDDLVESGAFDDVFQIEAHWTRSDGIPAHPAFWNQRKTGVAPDVLGHLAAVILTAITAKPRWVHAVGWNDYGRRIHGDAFVAHDTVRVLIGFEGGITADVLVAWAGHFSSAESLGVKFHMVDGAVDLPLMARETNVDEFMPEVARQLGGSRVVGKLTSPRPVQTEETFVLQARDWIAAFRDGAPLRFTAGDALRVQAIVDATIESAYAGQVVPVLSV